MTRRLVGSEKKPEGEGTVKRFLKYTALAAGLMAGCAAKNADSTMPYPMKPTGFNIQCKGSKQLAVGQEVWIGITPRAMHGLKIVKINEETVTVDRFTPIKMSGKVLKGRVDRIELPKMQVMLLFGQCDSRKAYSEEQRKILKEFQKPADAAGTKP